MCLRVVCGIGPALHLLPLLPHALRKPVPSTFSSPSYHPTRPCRLSLTRWSLWLLDRVHVSARRVWYRTCSTTPPTRTADGRVGSYLYFLLAFIPPHSPLSSLTHPVVTMVARSCACVCASCVVSDLLYISSHSYRMRCASPFPLLSPRLHTTPLALVVSHSPGGHYGC